MECKKNFTSFRNSKKCINKYVTEEQNKKNKNQGKRSLTKNKYKISSDNKSKEKEGNSPRETKLTKKKYKIKNNNKFFYNKSTNNIKKPFKIINNNINDNFINNNHN